MAKREEEFNVVVISRRQITVYPKLGQAVPQLLITYVAAGLPPNTLTFDKEKWTPEMEKRIIKEDIIRRLKERPSTYTV